MVAVSKTLMVSSSNDMNDSGKCRYKTGKCLNDRSFKRNGQFHQLCMFHREKANRIQRKFDRQKRSVAKENKTGPTKNGKVETTLSGHSFGAHRDCGEFFSDTDSYDGRLSVDSCDGIFKDDLWSSSSPMSDHGMSIKLEHLCDPEPVPVNSPVSHQGRLSVDEIDFLCSAMF